MIEQVITLIVLVVFAAIVIAAIEKARRNRVRNSKSVETLIDEVKGYGKPHADPLDLRGRQFIKEGQQQVEEEMAILIKNFFIIKDKETNNR